MRRPTERTQTRLLATFWDDPAETIPSNLDPTLAGTVHHLHDLADRLVPDPAFAVGLWQRLTAEVTADLPTPLRPRSARRPIRGASPSLRHWLPMPFRSPAIGTAATVLCVTLTLTLVVVVARIVGSPSRSASPHDTVVPTALWNLRYLELEGSGRQLTSLDPDTLADKEGVLDLSNFGHFMVLSDDGSTLVSAQRSHRPESNVAQTAIEVYAGFGGPRLAAYQLPYYVEPTMRLSVDGSRLVLEILPKPEQLGSVHFLDPFYWLVLDTDSGRVLSTVSADPDQGWPDGSWIDADAGRGYRLFLRHSTNVDPGPWPALIVGYDLHTGAEIGRLELPEVRGGSWVTGSIEYEGGYRYPEITSLEPGVALSPDGRTLALVHADEDAVTIIDTERMTVVRTADLERPASLGERLLGFLPLAPEDVSAKSQPLGTFRQAYFAADGRHLYVTGYEYTKDDSGEVVQRGAGIRLIDLEEGEIETEALDGVVIADLAQTTDGRQLYVSEVATGGEWYYLLRLDPNSLAVEAERFLMGHPAILLRPAVPTGTDHRIV